MIWRITEVYKNLESLKTKCGIYNCVFFWKNEQCTLLLNTTSFWKKTQICAKIEPIFWSKTHEVLIKSLHPTINLTLYCKITPCALNPFHLLNIKGLVCGHLGRIIPKFVKIKNEVTLKFYAQVRDFFNLGIKFNSFHLKRGNMQVGSFFSVKLESFRGFSQRGASCFQRKLSVVKLVYNCFQKLSTWHGTCWVAGTWNWSPKFDDTSNKVQYFIIYCSNTVKHQTTRTHVCFRSNFRII